MGQGLIADFLDSVRIEDLGDVVWLLWVGVNLPFIWLQQVAYAFGTPDGFDWAAFAMAWVTRTRIWELI